MFEKISVAPIDPILGLGEAYNNDKRDNKINLGIGTFQDEQGKTAILSSVKKAEQILLANEESKSYLPISGTKAYAAGVQSLILGKDHPVVLAGRAYTAHTPGGTGAVRIAADFLKQQVGVKRIWLSRPSWPNHIAIFKAAGLEVHEYDYYDNEHHTLNFDGMLRDLNNSQAGDAVLFHACCHNPTGVDPSTEQWRTLAKLSQQKKWLPFFDFAYQGFGHSLEEDAQAIRLFCENHDELIVASSFSKNFGLYNERTGALTLIAKESDIAQHSFSQIKSLARVAYSNPPAHGGNIVTTILNDEALLAEWHSNVEEMASRIKMMRQQLVQKLKEKGAKQNFDFILKQNGMFSFSGLSKQQVHRLRDEFGIYIVDSGRLNIAGITPSNIDTLAQAIVDVL